MEQVSLLYIDLSEMAAFQYQKPILSLFAEKAQGTTIFDLDGSSSAEMYAYAKQFIQEAEQVWLAIDARNCGTLQQTAAFIGLLNTMVQAHKKVKAALLGDFPMAEKMLGLLKENFRKVSSEDALIGWLTSEVG